MAKFDQFMQSFGLPMLGTVLQATQNPFGNGMPMQSGFPSSRLPMGGPQMPSMMAGGSGSPSIDTANMINNFTNQWAPITEAARRAEQVQQYVALQSQNFQLSPQGQQIMGLQGQFTQASQQANQFAQVAANLKSAGGMMMAQGFTQLAGALAKLGQGAGLMAKAIPMMSNPFTLAAGAAMMAQASQLLLQGAQEMQQAQQRIEAGKQQLQQSGNLSQEAQALISQADQFTQQAAGLADQINSVLGQYGNQPQMASNKDTTPPAQTESATETQAETD